MVYDGLKIGEGVKLEGEALDGLKNLGTELKIDDAGFQKIVDTFPGLIQNNQPVKPDPIAPEKYEFKLPENSKLDEVMDKEFRALMSGLNLSQDGAQKLIDLSNKFGTQYKKSNEDAYKAEIEGWKNESKILMGEGEAKAANEKLVAAFTKEFVDEDFKKVLGDYGFGDHPSFVKLALSIGAKISEGTTAGGSGAGGEKPDTAKVLFGDSTKK
jgi:hypothetical protein